MSFISVVTTKEFTSIMADGRIRDMYGNIVEEQFLKLRKFSDCIVGIVGNPGFLELLESNLELHGLAKTSSNVITIVEALMNTNVEQDDGQKAFANIIVTGLNEEKSLFCSAYTNVPNKNYDNLSYKLNKNDHNIRYFTMPPEDCSINVDFTIQNLFGQNFSKSGIKDIQSKLNDIVAKKTPSVNTNKYSIILDKKGRFYERKYFN